MKKYLLILFISTLTTFSSFAQSIAADTCISVGGGGGNVVIFANYDGGVLNINVDQNIPNLKIGVCTYEPVTINITGTYAANVTEVRYAGYVSTTNHHCANSPTTTTINGAGAAATSVNFLPPSTLANPNGYSLIVCGYTCSTNSNQGGCNTADQIQDYFTTTMGGSLLSYYTQYGCWSVSPYNISAGGNCPFTAVNDTTITIFSSSASSVCVGQPINFIDLSPGATSWTWTAAGSNTPTASSQNLSGVTWSSMGTYTVSLSTNDGTGNCSATQTITVLPNPNLIINASPNPICAGDTTILSVSGAFTYVWDNGPTVDIQQVHPTTDSWYAATGTDNNGCISTDSVFVNVNSIPSAPTINYSGGILTASPTASSYQWFLNGNPIIGANNQNYSPTQNGTYTVSYVDANGCSSLISLPTTVSDIGSGINELSESMNIYPNPSTGIYQITIPNTSSEVTIMVMDILGKVVYNKSIWMINSCTLDLSEQARGVYEVKIKIGVKVLFGKLLLQ